MMFGLARKWPMPFGRLPKNQGTGAPGAPAEPAGAPSGSQSLDARRVPDSIALLDANREYALKRIWWDLPSFSL